MGEVIQFPLAATEQLTELEAAFRESLVERDVSGELLEYALSRFKHHRERLQESGQYNFAVELPESLGPEVISSITESIESGVGQLKEFCAVSCHRLIVELVLSELLVHQYEQKSI